MQTEADEMLVASFDRLIREQHPIAYARTVSTHDEARRHLLWSLLDEGGWLNLWQFESRAESQALAIGELMGRALLTLPLAFSAYVLKPLCDDTPVLVHAGVILPPETHPGAGRLDGGGGPGRFVDYHGSDAGYYQLYLGPDRRTWGIRRYAGCDVQVLKGMDACGQLGLLPEAGALAEAKLTLAEADMARILRRYLAVELAQMIGAAAASLDMAIGYAKERRQFGRLIGQYQAIKHPLANAWVALDNGRYAVRALLNESEAGPSLAGTANRLVAAAAAQATKLSVQVHGGMGFAWEHDAHLFLKRVYHMGTQTRILAALLDLARA